MPTKSRDHMTSGSDQIRANASNRVPLADRFVSIDLCKNTTVMNENSTLLCTIVCFVNVKCKVLFAIDISINANNVIP